MKGGKAVTERLPSACSPFPSGDHTVAILDGYTDEPANFGVPPFLSTYPRYIAGAAASRGAGVLYATVDHLRRHPAAARELCAADILVLFQSAVVPGKYLRGSPMTRDEALRYARAARGEVLLGGASARFGFSVGGGALPEPPQVLRRHTPYLAPDHVDALVHDLLLHLQEGAPKPGPFQRRKRTVAEWNAWAVAGAPLAEMHPDWPEPLIAEIDTFTGCARYLDGGCRFCMEPLEGRPVYRDAPDVAAEVRALHDSGVRNFRLGGQTCFFSYKGEGVGEIDDPRPNVAAVRDLLDQVCDAAPERRVLHIDNVNPAVVATWPEESRAVATLVATRCTSGNTAAFGMESADPEVQRVNNLKKSPEQVWEATRLLNEVAGAVGETGLPALLPGYNFICGLPGESAGTYELNRRFLEQVLASGLLVRRVNIRQIFPARPPNEPMPPAHHGHFVSFKKWVRENFDHEMLKRVAPAGRRLPKVWMEARDGSNTFGRQVASYALLVGVPYEMPLERFTDIVVTDHGQRSVTGFAAPFPVNAATMRMLEALPGVGKKRAARIKAAQPLAGPDELQALLEDDALFGSLAPHLTFEVPATA